MSVIRGISRALAHVTRTHSKDSCFPGWTLLACVPGSIFYAICKSILKAL